MYWNSMKQIQSTETLWQCDETSASPHRLVNEAIRRQKDLQEMPAIPRCPYSEFNIDTLRVEHGLFFPLQNIWSATVGLFVSLPILFHETTELLLWPLAKQILFWLCLDLQDRLLEGRIEAKHLEEPSWCWRLTCWLTINTTDKKPSARIRFESVRVRCSW